VKHYLFTPDLSDMAIPVKKRIFGAQKFQLEVRGMAHTQAHNLEPRTFHSAPFVELQHSLPSRIQAISPSVDQLMRFILHFRIGDGSEIGIETAIREALANSVIHGNGENLQACLRRVPLLPRRGSLDHGSGRGKRV
jgi:hypothetical protein